MNKYQKQALMDLIKFFLAVMGVIALVQLILLAGVTSSTIFGSIGLVIMCYCVYQLYLVRVRQLESEDQRNNPKG
jgi:membrane protein YdbS with pleckstrin-like domain